MRRNCIEDVGAYRGYLIKKGTCGEYHVSKEGYHITTQMTLEAAKAAINSILD